MSQSTNQATEILPNGSRLRELVTAENLLAHGRRIGFLLLGFVLRTYIVYFLIGIYNRIFKQVDSVFFCYAGNEAYSNRYCYPSTRRILLWWPTLIAVFRQGEKWGLALATPVTEEIFTDPKQRENVEKLVKRTKLIARIVGAKQVSFAGILPSFLSRERITSEPLPSAKVANVVMKSVEEVMSRHFEVAPRVILVGGNGAIGSEIKLNLMRRAIPFETVDTRGDGFRSLPEYLRGKDVIILDVSRRGVLDSYVDEMWKECVLVNETFPEPSRKTINKLTLKGIPAYHISGVEGSVYPSFGNAYKNAIPCCAIHSELEDVRPIVIPLN